MNRIEVKKAKKAGRLAEAMLSEHCSAVGPFFKIGPDLETLQAEYQQAWDEWTAAARRMKDLGSQLRELHRHGFLLVSI
jgi:hypothetical protein